MGSKFSFGGQTWLQVSSIFDLSSSKWFEVRLGMFLFDPTLILNYMPISKHKVGWSFFGVKNTFL